jgi:hypothetical protein
MKVKQISRTNSDYKSSLIIEINGKKRFHVSDGMEPEDACLHRDLSDCWEIIAMIVEAYEAGKAGEELEIDKSDSSEVD